MYIVCNRQCFRRRGINAFLGQKNVYAGTGKVSLNFSCFHSCTYLSVSLSEFLEHVSVYLFLSHFLFLYFLVAYDDVISRCLVVWVRLKNGFEIDLRFFWLSQTQICLSPDDTRYTTILVISHLKHKVTKQIKNSHL